MKASASICYSDRNLETLGISRVHHAAARRVLDTVDPADYANEKEFVDAVKSKLRVFTVLTWRAGQHEAQTRCGGRPLPLGNTRCPQCDLYHETGRPR